jgi:uncharacterized protein (DUF1330 family)
MLVTINMLEDERWRRRNWKMVPAIVRSLGGENHVQSSGRPVVALEGDAHVPSRVALISFPSMQTITEFINLDAYRPYRDARMVSAFTNTMTFENLQGWGHIRAVEPSTILSGAI